MNTTLVIFRKFKDDGSIIALFPEQQGTNDPNTCNSYMHVGQHCPASRDLFRDKTKDCATVPATLAEFDSLERELISIGYRVKQIMDFQ